MADQFGLVDDIQPAEIPKEQDVFGLVNDITPELSTTDITNKVWQNSTSVEQKRISNAAQIADVHKISFDAAFDAEPQFIAEVSKVNHYLLNPAQAAWESIKQGYGGIVQSVGESLADKRSPAQQIADELGFELPKDMPELKKSMTPEFMTRFGERVTTKGREITLKTQKNIESMSPKEDAPYIEKLGFMVIHNLGVNAPGLVAAIITKRPMAALSFLGGVSYGNKYTEERKTGATPEEAHTRALAVAGSEVATEFIPISILLKPGLSIGKRIVQNLFSELVGENINTAYEMMQDKAIHDPDKTFGDFVVQDLLPAFKDTTLVAGISSLAMSGAVHPFVNGIDKTSEEATKKVLDEIASTPEGEKEIKDSVEKFKERAQNITGKAEEQLQKAPAGEAAPVVSKLDVTPEEAEEKIDNDWFITGRAGTQDLLSEYEKHEIYVSKEMSVAEYYAGKNGSIWLIKPKESAKILDATNDYEVENVVEELKQQYDNGNLSNYSNFRDLIDTEIDTYGEEKAWERIGKSLKPENIVEDEGFYSDTDFVNWLYETFEYDFVKTRGGGVSYNPNAVEIKRVQSQTEGIPPEIPPTTPPGVPPSEGEGEGIDLSEHLLAQKKGSIKESLLKGADKMIGIISTRLKNIHPEIKDALRRYVYETNKHIAIDNENAYGFVSKFSKLEDSAKIELSKALLNSQKETADTIAKQHGMLEEMNQARQTFEDTRNRALAAGLDVGKIENYWVRSIKDLEGLLNDLRKTEEFSAIDEVFRKEEKKKGSPLVDEEKAILINQMLRGVPTDRISLTSTSHLKERKFKEIPDKYLKYYMPADQSLLSYIKGMNGAIETAKLFGKGKGTKEKSNFNPEIITEDALDKSIGEYVNELKKKGQLKGSDEQPLRDMLQAVIRPGKTSEFVSLYKNLTYIQLLTQITPAITQIGDLAMSAEEAGYAHVAKVLGKAITRKSTVTLEDLHIDANKIIEEFEGGIGVIPRLLKKALNVTGFTAMDRIGKETLVNAKLLELVEQAKESDTVLKDTLTRMFGNEDNAEQVMHDLIQGNKTDDILFLLWNKLSDKQPITKLEVPEYYLTSGVGKIFYSLKTYQLKLLDIYRNDVWQEIRFGDKRKGYQKLITLTTALMLLGAGVDEAKDFILGRETSFSDLLINNLLKIGGFSKYTIYQTRREGFGRGLVSQFAPPFGILDTGTQDIDELIRKGELEKGARFTQHIPVVGKMYYWWLGRGSELKKEEKGEKFKR